MGRFVSCLVLLATLAIALIGCGGGGGGSSSSGGGITLSPSGGSYALASGVSLQLPAGAVSSDTKITAKTFTNPTPPSGQTFVAGTGHRFTHVTFSSPATLKITFPSGTPTSGLKIYRMDDGSTTWVALETTVDATARTASASITSFSSYALFYPAGTGWNWTSAGGTFTFDNLTVTVPADAVTTPLEVQPRRTPSAFTPPAGWLAVDQSSFDLGASNTSFVSASPFTVGVTYPDGSIPADASAISLFRKENETAEWVQLTTTVASADRTAQATATALGTFAVFYQPAPARTEVHYVESVSSQNNLTYNLYSVGTDGRESLVNSTVRNQTSAFLQDGSFYWPDRTYLATDTSGHLGRWSTTSNSFSADFTIPQYLAGSRLSDRIAIRSRTATSDYVVLMMQEENNTAGTAKDSLVRFQLGNATPEVIATFDRSASTAPTFLRPWDVFSDGRILGLRAEGLTLYLRTYRTLVIAPADLGPANATFSPSGNKVLFTATSGANAGWKIVDLATVAITDLPGFAVSAKLAWGRDDNHVIHAPTSGASLPIEEYTISTGSTTTLATRPVRTSLLSQIGSH